MARKPTDKLDDEARAYVVQELAMWSPPSVVVAALKKDFGVTITPQAVEAYNPTKRAGRNLSEKWTKLFEATRETFIESSAEIGISHRATRLRTLNRLAERAESMGNLALAAQLLEQAAKEMGNAYTNRRELTGKDGKDLPSAAAPVVVYQLPDNGRG